VKLTRFYQNHPGAGSIHISNEAILIMSSGDFLAVNSEIKIAYVILKKSLTKPKKKREKSAVNLCYIEVLCLEMETIVLRKWRFFFVVFFFFNW